MKKHLLTLLVSIFLYGGTFAQLAVSDGFTAQELANYFTGPSITPFNCSIEGEDGQIGKFSFTGNELGVNSGIIMSTGDIYDAAGPNSSSGTSYEWGGYGDDYLDDEFGIDTYDAIILEFDFTVQSDRIDFNYVFLSEEYLENVNSGYNDLFAFLISGPGISGEKNIAVVPGNSTPVTINTINDQSYWQFFHDNEDGNTNIEFDGFTTLMTATAEGLTACETYHLRLVIADGDDESSDSGVLLQESSLSQSVLDVSTNTFSGNDIAIESCVDASFTFQLDQPQPNDLQFDLEIAGTAVNGVDYEYIDPQVVIPAGQTSATLVVKAINDGLVEGQESIYLIYTPAACQEADTSKLFIQDFDQIVYSATPTDITCNGYANGIADFDLEGGFAPYTFNVTDTLIKESSTYTSLPILGLDSGTYMVQIIDSYGCTAKDIVFAGEFNAGQTFLPDGNGVSYESIIPISGFEDGQVLENAEQVLGITAILEHSYANDLTVSVQAPNGSEVVLKSFNPSGGGSCDLGEPVASGPVDDWNSSNITPGLGYEYTWNANPVYGTMNEELQQSLLSHTYVSTFGNTLTDNYLPAGSYATENSFDAFVGTELNGNWKILVTDNMGQDNGYIFSWNIGLKADKPDSIFTISQPTKPIVNANITNSNCNASDGEIDLRVTGDNSPFTFLWSNGATTEDIAGIHSGPYTVEITNTNLCVSTEQFNVSDNGGSLSLDAEVTNETCFETENGEINLTAIGTTPITFSWNSGQDTEDLNSLAPGDYTITVSDGGNCNAIETYTIESASEINLIAEVTPEMCGDAEGFINLVVSGGKAPYTFLWSSGETTSNIDELALGDYTVTVTDDNNCTKQMTYSITNLIGNCIPDCDIAITNSELSDEICGNQNGEISLTVFTSFSPYSVTWSNNENSDQISSLSAGSYTALVTDAEGCNLTQTFTIENQTGDLAISATTSDETCGNGTGSVLTTTTGGAQPYSFSWATGQTTEDISALNAGEYTLTVSDANNCSVSSTETVENIAGSLAQTWGNASNEICSNSGGSIDIAISGGLTPYIYAWSNGADTEDIIGIPAGTYSCTITDNAGCIISTPEYTVENEAGTLSLNNIDLDNEICGNMNGEIETIISGGTIPYSFSWNTGQDTQDIFNLNAGTYNLTVSDDNGCSVTTGDLALINSAGLMELEAIDLVHETCGNGQGEIDITVINGTLPYSYIWDNGNVAEDLNALSAGNFSCTITDDNGCEISFNTSINNEQGTLSVENITQVDEICGNAEGSVTLSVSGGNFPLIFDWSNGESTQNLTNLSEGSYSVTVTDDEGCTVSTSAEVMNDAGTLNLDNYAITNELCGDAQGSIHLTVSGDQTPITFVWSNGADTEDIDNLATGEYTCTITDNAGCKITAGPYNVNDFSQSLSIDNVVVTDEICQNAQGSVELTVSGGTGDISYSWNLGGSSNILSGLPSAVYTYTVSDETGCSVSGEAEVMNNSGTLEIASFNPQNEYCNNGEGEIDITINGGTQPYNYLWDSGQTSQDLTNLSAGTFSVTVSDDNGCEVQSTNITIINDNGDLEISDFNITDETCSSSNGEINIDVEGGNLPIFYSWTSGENSQDINNLQAGNYIVEVRDGQGCIVNGTYTVENIVDDFNTTASNITDENCGLADGQIEISVSPIGSYTFLWDDGTTNPIRSNLSAGSYSCEVSNESGCTLEADFDVANVTNGLSASLINYANDYCNAGSGYLDVNITGGTQPYIFIWNNGADTQNLTGISAGTYTLEVTDDTGCKATFNQQVINNINTELSITNLNLVNDDCEQGIGSINFEASPTSASYIYKLDGVESQTNSPLFENLTAGEYTISVHDGGCLLQEVVTIENNAPFDIFVQNIGAAFCGESDGAIFMQVGPQADYSYLWSNGSLNRNLQDVPAGEYTCIVTNNSTGCVQTITEEVPSDGWFSATADISNEMCSDGNGEVDLLVVDQFNQPKTYTWSNGETTEDITNLSAGTYTCVISAVDFVCEVEVVAEVINNTGTLSVSEFVQNDNCGLSSGYINLSISGTPQGYSVLWNTGETTDNISNLSAGDYSVIITDTDTGCELNTDYTIEEPGVYTYSEAISISSCASCADGEIDLTMNPTGEYTFDWDNSADTEDLSNLLPGDYTVAISNNYGCENTETYTVGACDLEIQSNTVVDEICQNGMGSIQITTSGGVSPVSYSWSNGSTSSSITGLSAGIYTVTVSDDASCTVSETYEVLDVITGFSVNEMNVSNETCGSGNGEIQVVVTPSGDYTYSWSNGGSSDEISGLSAGSYTVSITNLLGCVLTETADITNVTNGLTVSLNSSTNDNCSSSTGEIDINITDGNAPYSFLWSTGETSEDITGLSAGVYTVEVTDNSNCKTTFSHEIINLENSNLEITNVVITNDNCGQGDGSVSFEATSFGSYIYKLNDVPNSDNSSTFDGLTEGEYTISIHDGNCVAFQTISIENNAPFNVQFFNIQPEFCGNQDGVLEVQAFPPFINYSYEWSNGQSGQNLTDLAAGSYSCSITDPNTGCEVTVTEEVPIDGFFTVTASVTDETCSQVNGEIDLVVTDPFNDPKEYLWSTGETTEDLENLSAGIYDVAVSEPNSGCTVSLSVEVFNNTGSLEVSDYIHNDDCSNDGGFINLTVTGATAGYTVLWNNGMTASDITSLQAGLYSVSILDNQSNCEFTAEYTVEAGEGDFTVNETITSSSCASCDDGSVDLTVNPVGTYNYSWSNSEVSEDINNLLTGNYTVNVENSYGCEFTETYFVDFNIDVETLSSDISVNLYPNPAKEVIYFEFENEQSAHSKIIIYDIVGNVVAEKTVENNQHKMNFNIQSYASGIYLAKVSSGNKTSYLKFMVEK